MGWIPVFVIGGIVVIVGVVIFVNYKLEQRRTAEFRQLAEELGFEFDPTGGSSTDGWLDFELFSQGHSRKSRNAMRGRTRDLDVAVFDYEYTTGSGKHRHTHHQTVVGFNTPDADLPAFCLRPENVWHKIGGVFGYQDIDFESHPRFSRQYLLRGNHEAAIRELFADRALDYFDENAGLCIEGRRDRLIFHRERRIMPHEVREFLERAFEVLGVFRPRVEKK